MLAFWLDILAQHYGPGSRYLDVTHSLDVAIWFALHSARQSHVDVRLGYGEELRSDDVAASELWRTFSRAPQGWIYVFDVPRREDDEQPSHGELIDIATAPPMFQTSARFQRQHAALIRCDPTVNGGDVSSFLVCEPLSVARPLSDSPALSWSVEDLFPPYPVDPWYQKFLSIPFVPQAEVGSGTLHLHRAAPTIVYNPYFDDAPTRTETPALIREVRFGANDWYIARSYRPVLVHESIDPMTTTSSHPLVAQRASFRDAIVIVSEGNMGQQYAPWGNRWNHSILVSDIGKTVAVVDCATGIEAPPVETSNVFLELSPLESLARGAAQMGDASSGIDIRAIWLVRGGHWLTVNLCVQDLDHSASVSLVGPFHYMYDQDSERVRSWDSETSLLVENESLLGLLALPLTALRALSPAMKLDPVPWLQADDTAMVGVRPQLAILLRLSGPNSRRAVHVMRKVADHSQVFGGLPRQTDYTSDSSAVVFRGDWSSVRKRLWASALAAAHLGPIGSVIRIERTDQSPTS